MQVRSEADFAAKHGLSPVSFAIYEMLERIESVKRPQLPCVMQEEQASYRTHFDEGLIEGSLALNVEATAKYKHNRHRRLAVER